MPADHNEWFRQEVQPHDHQLKAYLRGAFPAVRDVEDVVQESYLRVWRRQMERPIASARAFLFTVARHLALDTLRHNRVSPIDAVTDLSGLAVIDEKPGTAETVCTNQEVEFLFEAISALPAHCREVVILRKIQGLSQKEIAAKLGLSENTVAAQATRGLRRLEKFMAERGVIHRP